MTTAAPEFAAAAEMAPARDQARAHAVRGRARPQRGARDPGAHRAPATGARGARSRLGRDFRRRRLDRRHHGAAQGAQRPRRRFKAVSLSRNFGKEIAAAAGLTYATGDAAVLMDADLQHPPELIVDFVPRWREGFEIVYGQRSTAMPTAFCTACRRAFSTPRSSSSAAPRCLPGPATSACSTARPIDAMNRMGERVRFNKGLYAWMGFRSVGVPFDVPPAQQRQLALAAAPAAAFRARWHDVVHDDPAAGVVLPRSDHLAVRVLLRRCHASGQDAHLRRPTCRAFRR